MIGTAGALRGIELAPLSEWLEANVDGAQPPFEFDLAAAGGSNLSYVLGDAAGHRWVLRRGPVAARLATAHDMSREWRVISALAGVDGVPVPTAVAFCDDAEVTGASFYVMECVDGLILRDLPAVEASALDAAACQLASDSLIDVQVALHRVNPASVGLADFGREGDYVERQLHRWQRQVSRSTDSPPPLLAELGARLAALNPGPQAPPALVHGDYRFDNVVLGTDHRLAAVLDWELCTIGDPVADFFWTLLYWSDPGDAVVFIPNGPTLHPHFARRVEIVRRYGERSGFDLSAATYFNAFGYWKMACIVTGVLARIRHGAGGGMRVDQSGDSVEHMIANYLEASRLHLAKF